MKLTIRSVGIWSHPNIRTWEPDDPAILAETINIEIGPKKDKGSDSFSIRVCTPAGLETLEPRNGILATRPLLVMSRYSFTDLWQWLEQTVQACEAETWKECIEKLRNYFDWEYDRYKEH